VQTEYRHYQKLRRLCTALAQWRGFSLRCGDINVLSAVFCLRCGRNGQFNQCANAGRYRCTKRIVWRRIWHIKLQKKHHKNHTTTDQ